MGPVTSRSSIEAMPLLERLPFAPLVDPGKKVGDLAQGCFANRKTTADCRSKVENLNLDVGRKVVQTNDLADSFPAQAAQPRQVRVVFGFTATDHIFQMDS